MRARKAPEALFAAKRPNPEPSTPGTAYACQPVSEATRSENLVAGFGPSCGKCSANQRRTSDARDPEVAICTHPWLGKLRDDGGPNCGSLRRCRRGDRAHSQSVLKPASIEDPPRAAYKGCVDRKALEFGRGLHELLRQLLKPDHHVALHPRSVRCHQREFLDTGVAVALEIIGLDRVGVR